ncbi:SpoIVB peptidase S55 domain-containing protein [Nocardioides sp.]|uniref:SpoIVB peptidase S55 domain-containing protein n=1 Tax=Nocardioides sp. TaxID=35761 RepID=UPI002721A06E|nr:SpoIVB peptidase S55 domain-containing protein [Nocardioides sp.]MDO9457386.1 SpoIVB peptidase S55 domain-containing protein [Nocardioides sp.]
MPLTPRRRRILSLATAATLTLALPAAGASLLASPAQSADPVADCAAPVPVAEIAAGDSVDGLTVTQGTTPTGFTGEVLGVLEDGIAPDVDMIMVDVDMPEFARTGGIWQGMSGSPVYADDGRLIGAVAYGLSYGPSPIAGITPFAEMDDYLAGGTPVRGSLRLGAADARTVAARAGITTAQAASGFRELPMPMGISGITPRRLSQLQAKGPKFVEKTSYVMGKAPAAVAGPETVIAGGNIAASVAYGDISMAGVGTATSVCDGRVVGFGHPLALLGATTEGLHPADAIYVQPDSLGAPFKVANIAPPVGTITDDRLTGITGAFGAAPAATQITSEVTYGTKSRTGTTAVSVQEFAAEATFYQLIANQDRVVDGPSKGSELFTWTITGTDRDKPFSLTYTDRWTGTDLSSEPSYNVANLVSYLGSIDGIKVGTVDAEAAVNNDLKRHTLVAVEQRRGGQWVRVTRQAPALGRAGKPIQLRVVLGGTAGKQLRWLKPILLPKRAKGELVLAAQGGDNRYSDVGGETLAQVRAALAKQFRHDQVQVQVGTPDKVDFSSGDDEEFDFRRAPRLSFVSTQVTAPLANVVSGNKLLTIVIR